MTQVRQQGETVAGGSAVHGSVGRDDPVGVDAIRAVSTPVADGESRGYGSATGHPGGPGVPGRVGRPVVPGRGGRSGRRPVRGAHRPAGPSSASDVGASAVTGRDEGQRAPAVTSAPAASAGAAGTPVTSASGGPTISAELSASVGSPGSAIRAVLRSAADGRAALLMVTDHRGPRPRVFGAPVDRVLAGDLLDLAADVSGQAADAEWRAAGAGFAPAPGQWAVLPIADTALAALDEEVRRPTHAPYQRTIAFGRSNLMVLRVRSAGGDELFRLYQGFSPDKALGTGRRLVAFWSGERFSALTEPLVIDRSFRVVVVDGVALMPTAASYEALFGPPAAMRVEAAATFAETFAGALDVRGVDELRTACLSDLSMMRKLLSIRRRMADPGFRAALTMDRILAFLAANPQIGVPVDRGGPVPQLVFESGPQQRWALLKLLDDDYLRSDLTGRRYEANSKGELG